MGERVFQKLVGDMELYFYTLKKCPPTAWSEVKEICGKAEGQFNKGVYVFYKDGQALKALYVGRSDDLLGRVRTHGNKGSRKGEAAFAAKIARKKVMQAFKDKNPCTDTDKELRNALNKELRNLQGNIRQTFDNDFATAKESIRNMKVRVVKVEDSIDQAIFEIYAHVRLGTPYNDFDNH